jgi:hypothetical protein
MIPLIMEKQNLENALAHDILMMIAGFFDTFNPAGDSKGAEAMVKAAKLAADGIAAKLTKAIVAHPGELDPKQWQRWVNEATRHVFIKLPWGGPRVKLSENPTFALSVAACMTKTVAPPGSEWELADIKREEEGMRDYLTRLKVPAGDITRLVRQLRSCRTPPDLDGL